MGDEEGDEEGTAPDVQRRPGRGARTERASAWNASRVFSEAGLTGDGATKTGYDPAGRRGGGYAAAGRAASAAGGRASAAGTARGPKSLRRVRTLLELLCKSLVHRETCAHS